VESILFTSSLMLWVIVLINFFLTLALIRRITMKPGETLNFLETLKPGQNAPDFMGEALTGEQVTFSDYVGRSLALIFISPDCGICNKKIPQLNALEPQARQSGTELVLICNADVDQTRDYVQKYNITPPILSAPRQTNPFFENYKAIGVPFYTIVDHQGLVQATSALGDPRWEEITRRWVKGGA
jgi:peroxiredoxin